MADPAPDRLPISYEEWERQARGVLEDGPYYYIAGGAGGGQTMKNNREAFDRRSLIPRMLQNIKERDLNIELFGQRYDFPLLQAPVGVQSIIHQDGELTTAGAPELV